MKTINKIMVAVDFSDDSSAAARYAVKLGKDVNATLLLVNIINQRDVDMMDMVVRRVAAFSVEKYLHEQTNHRKERFKDLVNEIDAGDLEIQKNIRVGVPYKALLKEIEEEKPDLLVMGVKGRSNLIDTVIGSCAQKMFRRSPIPLLSIRGHKSKKD